jgi:hypothetical protein
VEEEMVSRPLETGSMNVRVSEAVAVQSFGTQTVKEPSGEVTRWPLMVVTGAVEAEGTVGAMGSGPPAAEAGTAMPALRRAAVRLAAARLRVKLRETEVTMIETFCSSRRVACPGGLQFRSVLVTG